MIATQTAMDEVVDFLDLLYGDADGYLAIFGQDGKTRWCRATERVSAASAAFTVNRSLNVWFGAGLHPAPLDEQHRGTASGVSVVPGCWLDLDIAGPAHAEPHLPPTEGDALALLRSVPIAPTVIVHSGHGLQPWWLFKEPFTIESDDERQRVASVVRRLQALVRDAARAQGWRIDATADLARVLRLPGTTNRKLADAPAPVRVIHRDDLARYALEEIEAFLPDEVQLGWTASEPSDDRDFAPANYDRAVAECAWLAHCEQDAASLPEPSWYAQASIVGRCLDGERIFHDISRSYPRYTRDETDHKLHQALAKAGPRTCRYIREVLDGESYCAGCTHWGRVTTPLQLGRARDSQITIARDTSGAPFDPLIPRTGSPDWPAPLDTAAFHGLAGETVRAIEPHTEADPAALLLSYLATVGNLVGPGPHWTVSGAVHGLRVWPVLVGTTSKGRKGTAWSSVKPVFKLAAPEWAASCFAGGLSSGEGLIYAVRDQIVKLEKTRGDGGFVRYEEVITDPGVTDKRLLVVEEEFASVMRMADRDGSSLSTTVRQAWDSGDLRTMVKNSPNRATGAHITIMGHITRDELLQYLTRTDAANGFANRFLWTCVRRSKELPDGGNLDPDTIRYYAEQLAAVLETAKLIGLIERDPDATAMWHTVYGPLSSEGVGLLGAVTSRAESQVMRLAAIYAVLDETRLITPDHLLAALAVWQYVEDSCRFIFGEKLGDPDADTILAALRTNGPMAQTEISNVFSRHLSAARIQAALDRLTQAGRATSALGPPTGGRPPIIWRAL